MYLKASLDMVAIAATLDNTLGALLIGTNFTIVHQCPMSHTPLFRKPHLSMVGGHCSACSVVMMTTVLASLYGFTTLQTYTYFSGGSRGDSIWLRSLVSVCCDSIGFPH